MTYKCNGCGGEFDTKAAVFAFGDPQISSGGVTRAAARADHFKTLCPRCQHVLKDILMSSDLSDQWDSYDWTLKRDEAYVEEYDDD
jgi:hypothetical protein